MSEVQCRYTIFENPYRYPALKDGRATALGERLHGAFPDFVLFALAQKKESGQSSIGGYAFAMISNCRIEVALRQNRCV